MTVAGLIWSEVLRNQFQGIQNSKLKKHVHIGFTELGGIEKSKYTKEQKTKKNEGTCL